MKQEGTFEIPGMDRGTKAMAALDREEVFSSLLQGKIEGIYESEARMVSASDVHPLALAAEEAFYRHYPLELSPDALWFCIAQGFAHHVNLHAEALRKRFVQHEGKLLLLVERPDFILGQKNPWPEVFAAFSEQIAAHVGKLRELVVADFSTTGPIERAASEVLLMDTFQAYFEYGVMCGCGIPAFTLRGTPADWRSVKQRASHLAEYGLEAWIEVLLPVLDHCIEAAEGRPDVEFWRSFFRYQSGSGPSELTGWIHTLFPYIKDNDDKLIPNPYMAQWREGWEISRTRGYLSLQEILNGALKGPPIQSLPGGFAKAPVKLIDGLRGTEHEGQFIGGMFGVVQDEGSLTVRPEFGWAVLL